MKQRMPNLIEKRQHLRMNRMSKVTLESLQFGIDDNTRMLNCSDHGIYFESNQFLQPGSDVFIRVETWPDILAEESYKCHHAKITWGKKLNSQPYAYGYGAKYAEIAAKKSQSETEAEEMMDLRKYPRKYCGKPVKFKIEDKSCVGFINDISRNGCFIENNEFLENGQVLDLVIPGTKFSVNNLLKAEVVRLSPIGVGVKFKRIENRGRTTATY